MIHAGHHFERRVEMNAHRQFSMHGVSALQRLSYCRMLFRHFHEMARNGSSQLQHAVEMNLCKGDELPDSGIATDPRNGRMEFVIDFRIILQPSLPQDLAHAVDDILELCHIGIGDPHGA